MWRPDLQAAMQAVGTRRIIDAAAQSDWPSVLCAPSKPPASSTIQTTATAAYTPLLQRPLSRRAMRRARGKAKE